VKRVLGWFLVLLFLAATTAGLWLPPVISHAVEKDYRFTEVAIDATVEPNGDVLLEERRTFDFRNGPFTYAYFNVDDPDDHVRDFSIAEVRDDGTERAVEPTSASHSIVTNGFQAQWDYVAEDEERTWIFRYRVACAVAVYPDTAHLYWQFIGTGWDKSTVHAVITVHLPDRSTIDAARPATCDPDDRPELPAGATGTPLEQGDVRAFGHGPLNGSVTFEDASTVVYDAHGVPPASFVEASILFPTDAVPLAPERSTRKRVEILAQERAWAQQANVLRARHDAQRRWVSILLVAVPLALALLVWIARLRDRVADVPDVLEQPPEDDSVAAALLWSAWHGHVSPQNAYRAQIMRLARLGAIEIQAEGLVTDPKDLTLVRKMGALDLPNAEDQDFMWLLFGRTQEKDSISLKQMRSGRASAAKYTTWYGAAKTKTGSILSRVEKGDARFESVSAFAIAFGAAGYGLWTAVWGLGGRIGWWLVPVSLISLIVALRMIPARLREEDRRRVMKLAAFRRYLKDFSDLPNAPALAVVIWEQYLEWAVALGVADEVEKQVTAIVPVESLRSPIPGGPTGLAGINTFHAFQTAAATMVLTSMSSGGSSSGGFGSSSSSSGFSSGGFSSGGGGGGGGTGGGAG
jgi:uncharacterized membrane protein YgcG